MKVIVGLGNPGEKYSQTRHNIGFMVVEKLAERWQGELFNKISWHQKKNYQMAECRSIKTIGINENIVLVKPQTYMNLSGEAVLSIVNWYKVSAQDIIVVYDDIDLPTGKIRIKSKGGAGGHRGVESLIEHLASYVFPRVKIGVDRPPDDWEVADYVLSRFRPEEAELLTNSLNRAADAIECILSLGISEAMNRFNNLS